MGNITKIGGLIFKLIGAKKAGVKIALVPKENEGDYNEIVKNNPNLINNKFTVKIINNINDIVKHMLIL